MLFERWTAPCFGFITIQWIAQFVMLTLIHWIVIYLVDSVIHLQNNWDQIFKELHVYQRLYLYTFLLHFCPGILLIHLSFFLPLKTIKTVVIKVSSIKSEIGFVHHKKITVHRIIKYLIPKNTEMYFVLYVVLLQRLSEGAQLNYEQNMHDAIAIMNKLQTGLDVNVKFTG